MKNLRTIVVLHYAIILVIGMVSLPTAWAQFPYRVFHRFAANPGNEPLNQPVLDAAGNLYVTTVQGGPTGAGCSPAGCGTVYQISPTGVARPLYGFKGGNDGDAPKGRLLLDATGNIYGVTFNGGGAKVQDCGSYTYSGCGIAFKLSPTAEGSYHETVLYAFTVEKNGYLPSGGLTFDSAGNLYGATQAGGDGSCGLIGCGVIYELSPNSDGTWTQTVLHVFTGVNGDTGAIGELAIDSTGNLYGTAWNGGTTGNGRIFELSPESKGTWHETVLYNFTGNPDAANPVAGVTFDAAGNLFGITQGGGLGSGTVFELSPTPGGGWTESVLYSFRGGHVDGGDPLGAATLDAEGNIYGTTAQGGNGTGCGVNGCGIVFKLSASDGWVETPVHVFKGTSDGGIPQAGVAFDSAGNLYGTASFGQPGNGLLYRIIP